MQHSLVYTPEYEKESQMLLTIIRRSTQVDRYEYPAALFVVPIDSDSQQSTTHLRTWSYNSTRQYTVSSINNV